MKNKTKLLFGILSFIFVSQPAFSTVTLLDQNEWKILMSGFVETDVISDSTRSFTEVIGNNPVVSSAGRTQFSIRNSRLAFTILPPVQDDWKSKGYFEFDLLGYDPAPPASTTAANNNTESSFYTNPTMRIRHAYLGLEKNGWQILTGQSWTLFGWQPSYVLTTVSVPPAPGVLYQRTPEVMAVKKLALGDSENLQVGASLARPSQRDSGIPNIDAGVRFTSARRSSGFSSPSGDVSVEPMSLAVTGTRRDFVTPNSTTTPEELTHHAGYAFAADLLLPLIAAGDEGVAGSLTATAELTQGNGYGDAFSGWSGNLAQFPANSVMPSVSSATNLDAGQGGFDANGDFHLVNLRSWNFQLQYHFGANWRAFMTAGYSQLKSDNVKDLSPVSSGKTVYDQTDITFINFFHDCTKQIRIGLEYSQIRTHYIDDTKPLDHRYQASFFFRF